MGYFSKNSSKATSQDGRIFTGSLQEEVQFHIREKAIDGKRILCPHERDMNCVLNPMSMAVLGIQSGSH